MNAKKIANRLYDEKATLQSRYNRLSDGCRRPGVDVAAIKNMLANISEEMASIDRQLDTLGQ